MGIQWCTLINDQCFPINYLMFCILMALYICMYYHLELIFFILFCSSSFSLFQTFTVSISSFHELIGNFFFLWLNLPFLTQPSTKNFYENLSRWLQVNHFIIYTGQCILSTKCGHYEYVNNKNIVTHRDYNLTKNIYPHVAKYIVNTHILFNMD